MNKAIANINGQMAHCRCGKIVKSQVKKPGCHDGDHVAQGINCIRCGTLHIFTSDAGHSETFLKDIGLIEFYKIIDLLVKAGLSHLFPGGGYQ